MASRSDKQLTCADYHVAWISPSGNIELLPTRLMLDEYHKAPPYETRNDDNTYIFSAINDHAIVVATCPPGDQGNANAGRLTGSMFKTFPNIKMAVLVGIGGGIPRQPASEDPLDDIHFGEVVVGWPVDAKPACVYYDRGRTKADGQVEVVGTMQKPDWILGSALTNLVSDHEVGRTTFDKQLARLHSPENHAAKFAYPGIEHDRLFQASYHHIGKYGSDCIECDPKKLVQRPPRTEHDKYKIILHQGRIATGNKVVMNGEERDRIREICDGALCVEMEAAGVDVNRQCLVIRGISDYADMHKNDKWRSYAAGNAAAFTRELLCKIQPYKVRSQALSVEQTQLHEKDALDAIEEGNRLYQNLQAPTKDALSRIERSYGRAKESLEKRDPPDYGSLTRAYRGFTNVHLERSGTSRSRWKQHLAKAEEQTDLAWDAASRSQQHIFLSQVRFDYACIKKRRSLLLEKYGGEVPNETIRSLREDAFKTYREVGQELMDSDGEAALVYPTIAKAMMNTGEIMHKLNASGNDETRDLSMEKQCWATALYYLDVVISLSEPSSDQNTLAEERRHINSRMEGL